MKMMLSRLSVFFVVLFVSQVSSASEVRFEDVDMSEPYVSITNAPDIDSFNVLAYEVSGVCSHDGQTVIIDASGIIGSALCISGAWSSTLDLSSLADGVISITADHYDANENPAVQAVVSIIKIVASEISDSYVSITHAADINQSNVSTYVVSGTCRFDNHDVNINVGSITALTVCTNGAWSYVFDVSSLADGSVLISADQDDELGNPGIQSVAYVIKKTISPYVSITHAADINQSNVLAYEVSGVCSDDNHVVNVDVGGITASPVCTNGVWSYVFDVSSLVDSNVLITADHEDAFGNPAVQSAVSVTKTTVIF